VRSPAHASTVQHASIAYEEARPQAQHDTGRDGVEGEGEDKATYRVLQQGRQRRTDEFKQRKLIQGRNARRRFATVTRQRKRHARQ